MFVLKNLKTHFDLMMEIETFKYTTIVFTRAHLFMQICWQFSISSRFSHFPFLFFHSVLTPFIFSIFNRQVL